MIIHPECPYCHKIIDINIKTIDLLQKRIRELELDQEDMIYNNKSDIEMPEFMKDIFKGKL